MKLLALTCVLAVAVSFVQADLYLHNPRGSNNRLNTNVNTQNVQNQNRLFDSQNNAKGGYCWGPSMSYYEGSQLSIEWTVQHGCGNPNMECQLILQYMCGDNDADLNERIRDGTGDENDQVSAGAYADPKYGMHESFNFFDDCNARERNKGLFIADRNLNGDTARFTRQNNGGTQRGFECAEERDYYPYWHPAPWKDIAIITDNEKRCGYYEEQSQNVKSKNYCARGADGAASKENNEAACEAAGKEWKSQKSWGLGAPNCVPAGWSRDNHLGNTASGFASSYNWTLPTSGEESCIEKDKCNCVFRIRYNITTGDYDAWNINSLFNGKDKSPVTQDPTILVGELQDQPADNAAYLELALNTNQFGRTFQDRSHVFHIKPRPGGVASTARVFNLNVRGKRGNIVQTYPATEYDFVPNRLGVRRGDYIHFQWTGSDSNPAGNDGEGQQSTDRTNIVQIANLAANKPAPEDWLNSDGNALFGRDDRLLFAHLNQSACGTKEEQEALNENDPNNCLKLNKANQYFNGGLKEMSNTGTFYFMNTRNNNFSNRSQKGILYVDPLLPSWAVALVVTGSVFFVGSAGVGAAMLYAKRHPHSKAADIFKKVSEVTG